MLSKRITPALIGLLLMAGACHKRPKANAPTPPLFAHTIIVSSPPPTLPLPRRLNIQPVPVSQPLNAYQLAVRNLRDGKYDGAAQALEEYLKDADLKNRESAIFYLALSRCFMALNSGSARDMRTAKDELDSLLASYPEGQYKAAADIIRRLLDRLANERSEQSRLQKDMKEKDDQIQQLKDELQKLKDIDMKRNPSRPPP